MKKILITLLLITSVFRFAHANSCVDFVNMSEADALVLVNSFQRTINNISYDPSADRYKDKDLVLKNSDVFSDMGKCIQLRAAKHQPVSSIKRIDALDKLNNMSLTTPEKSIYNQSIEENKNHYSGYSEVSLINSSCNAPLIYLMGQNTSSGILVYEKRLNSANKIQTLNGYLSSKSVTPKSFKCGDNIDIQKNHSEFLNNKNGVSLNIDIAEESFLSSINPFSSDKKTTGNTYMNDYSDTESSNLNDRSVVTKGFSAVNYQMDKKVWIKKGSLALSIQDAKYEIPNNEVFFLLDGKIYRANKRKWNLNTK